jgi:hypothetical protein
MSEFLVIDGLEDDVEEDVVSAWPDNRELPNSEDTRCLHCLSA